MFARDGLLGKMGETSRKDPRGLPEGQPAKGASQRPPVEAPRAEPERPAPVPTRGAVDGKGSKLIVGPDIKLKGADITDCDTLVVEGRVEASMDSRMIEISEQGVFCGTAGVDIAEIHGRFEGELTVRKQLVVHATGRVTGKIRYARLMVEEGGELTGDIGTMGAANPFGRRDETPSPTLPSSGLL